jgi:hypothetical protein
MKRIDPTTWIDKENRAANHLADLLTEICDESLAQKVNVYFHRFNIKKNALSVLDKGNRTFFLLLLLDKTQNEVIKNIRHETVASLMLNILSAMYRREMYKINPKDDRAQA